MAVRQRPLKQYLVLAVAGQKLALPLDWVAEVCRIVAITPLPQAPPFLRGLVQVRGEVVPVVDLRLRLGYPEKLYSLDHAMVLVRRPSSGLVALVVDKVEDVSSLEFEETKACEELLSLAEFVERVGIYQQELVFVLDVEKVLDFTEIPIVWMEEEAKQEKEKKTREKEEGEEGKEKGEEEP